MKTLHAIALLALSILLVSSWSGQARASLSWEFGFIGVENGFSGSGSFTLDGPDGRSDSVTAYEYSGVCGLDASGNDILCNFGLSDIFISDWSLLPDWSFETLFFEARITSAGTDLRILTLNSALISDCVDLSPPPVGCNGIIVSSRTSFYPGGAFLTPIHDVPEPHTFGLFMIGLLALAAAGWLPRRRRNSGGSLSGV